MVHTPRPDRCRLSGRSGWAGEGGGQWSENSPPGKAGRRRPTRRRTSATAPAAVPRSGRLGLGALLLNVCPGVSRRPPGPRAPQRSRGERARGRRRKCEKSLPHENPDDVVTTPRPTVREDQEADSQKRVCAAPAKRLSSTTCVTRPPPSDLPFSTRPTGGFEVAHFERKSPNSQEFGRSRARAPLSATPRILANSATRNFEDRRLGARPGSAIGGRGHVGFAVALARDFGALRASTPAQNCSWLTPLPSAIC